MIKNLTVENYRGFKQFRLEKLSRVNLLVGKNNCGKTALLEAVQLLRSEGHPQVLSQIAQRRREVEYLSLLGQGAMRPFSILSQLFHGHEVTTKETIKIDVDSDDYIMFSISRGAQTQPDVPSEIEEDGFGLRFVIYTPGGEQSWRITNRGAMPLPLVNESIPDPEENVSNQKLLMVDNLSLTDREIGILWKHAVVTKSEPFIYEALRIIEEDILDVIIVDDTKAFVSVRGKTKRVPIGSMGDGMRRMLSIALALSYTSGGTLLIDEIDTGLHHTVLRDMWKLVVQTAVKHDIQVFATTHSLDCINNLAWMIEENPDLENEVSIQKIHNDLDHSVALGAEQIKTSVRFDMEVR